jgi:hypothetical protein
MSDLRKDLDKLASQIAQKATQETTPLAESVDAFKSLVTYYVALAKQKSGDEPADGATFADFGAALSEETNGAVRGGSRRRPSASSRGA